MIFREGSFQEMMRFVNEKFFRIFMSKMRVSHRREALM